MRTIFRFIPVAILIAILSGCAAQKKAVVTAESEILHQQALKALEDHRFIIQAEEFHFPDGEPVKYSTDSYISMQDNYAIVRYNPDVFPGSPLEHLNVEDKEAALSKDGEHKNGDLQFRMKINGHKEYLKHEFLITLYKNTNKCMVQVYGKYSGNNMFWFTGKICSVENN